MARIKDPLRIDYSRLHISVLVNKDSGEAKTFLTYWNSIFGNYRVFLEVYEKHNFMNVGFFATDEASAVSIFDQKLNSLLNQSPEVKLNSCVDLVTSYGPLDIGEILARLVNLGIFDKAIVKKVVWKKDLFCKTYGYLLDGNPEPLPIHSFGVRGEEKGAKVVKMHLREVGKNCDENWCWNVMPKTADELFKCCE